jgi:hypothetical protein
MRRSRSAWRSAAQLATAVGDADSFDAESGMDVSPDVDWWNARRLPRA